MTISRAEAERRALAPKKGAPKDTAAVTRRAMAKRQPVRPLADVLADVWEGHLLPGEADRG